VSLLTIKTTLVAWSPLFIAGEVLIAERLLVKGALSVTRVVCAKTDTEKSKNNAKKAISRDLLKIFRQASLTGFFILGFGLRHNFHTLESWKSHS
jgi:hypothetical protein